MLDQRATPPPTSTRLDWTSAIAFAALAVGLLHLLVLNLQPTAPVWQWTARHPPQLVVEERLAAMDEAFLAAAGGRNLSMHFEGFDTSQPGAAQNAYVAY